MLHSRATARDLAVARIVVFGLSFWIVATTAVQQYPRIPAELVEARGFARIIPMEELLGSLVTLRIIQGATLVGCALCVLGVRAYTPVAVATVVLLFVHDAEMKSIGAWVNHGSIGILVVGAVLAVSPAADALALRRRSIGEREPGRYAAPLVVAATFLTVSYSFVGARRLAVGGLDVFTIDTLERYVVSRSVMHGTYGFERLGLEMLGHPAVAWLFLAGFIVTTAFELLSPLAITHPRFRAAWLAVIVPFHVVTLVTMNIFFLENLILILLLMAGGTRLASQAISAGQRRLGAFRGEPIALSGP